MNWIEENKLLVFGVPLTIFMTFLDNIQFHLRLIMHFWHLQRRTDVKRN